MTAPTHIIVALASSVALQQISVLRLDIFQILLILVGGLAPDIDTDGSITKPGKILYRFIGPGFARLIDDLLAVFLSIIHKVVRHRGFFHWPLFCLVLFIIAKYYQQEWLLFFALGYATHLFADFLTKGGIPVLGPFTKKNYSVALCRIASPIEYSIALGLLIYCLVFGFQFLPTLTQKAYLDGWEVLKNFFVKVV